jgi:putative ABC transport system permease protein
MFKLLNILWNSLKMALQELKANKLRTFLSLFGITIGIFCIIGVLATIDSMEQQIQRDIASLGSNTIWIDKYDYSQQGPDMPWWKYQKRPTNKYQEMQFLKEHTSLAANVAYFVPASVNVSFENSQMQNVSVYSVSNDFDKIQELVIAEGRYMSEADFERGTPVCVIGYTNAEDLFGNAERAVGKQITLNGKKTTIVGLIEKQGNSLLPGGFQFDACFIIAYRFYAAMFNPEYAGQNLIMVQPKEGVAKQLLVDELRGNMRQLRKLSPKEEDNFALNDIQQFSDQIGAFFGSVNIGGWAIAGLSLIVGAFGVANIMFVTVRERTSQIGLKKAIGAKSRTILSEFLLESAFLCVIGGLIGLLMVWLLALVLSSVLPFPIVIAPGIIVLALSICIVLGILSGIIPASIAAKMNPVVAIRTK